MKYLPIILACSCSLLGACATTQPITHKYDAPTTFLVDSKITNAKQSTTKATASTVDTKKAIDAAKAQISQGQQSLVEAQFHALNLHDKLEVLRTLNEKKK